MITTIIKDVEVSKQNNIRFQREIFNYAVLFHLLIIYVLDKFVLALFEKVVALLLKKTNLFLLHIFRAFYTHISFFYLNTINLTPLTLPLPLTCRFI